MASQSQVMRPKPPEPRDEREDTGPVALDDTPPPVIAKGTREDVAAQARAAAAGQIHDDVVSIAHDLKNPLSIIMMETSLLEQRLAARSPAVQRGLEHIARNAAYVDRLISELLDLASADAGALSLNLERVDLARLVQDALARCVGTVDAGRVHFDIRAYLYAHADPIRIERVIANLVTNALKHSAPHSAVTVRLDARGRYACISVIDNGHGLTAEEARGVFQRFRRGRHGQQHHGYGLGLYISRRIVEAHGGRIGLHSEPQRGSRFFFELPLAN